MTTNETGIGLYRHYKGGLYLITGVSRTERNGDVVIEYTSYQDGCRWNRPALEWVELVRWADGKLRARYERVRSQEEVPQ